MWRWLPWVLPAVFIGGRVLLGGGWEVFFLVLYSPLIVGLGGFLAWLPRFILRNKQYTTAPTLFVVVLTAHWVSMVWYLLSMRAVGDSGSQPSIVSAMVPFMTAQQESLFHAFALLFVALTLLVAFTMAILVRNADDPPLTMRRAGAGWWVLAAFIVTPLVIFGSASATDAIKLRGKPDAGGNQQADGVELTAQILPPTDASNDPVIRLQARSPLFWSEGTAVTWEHIDPDDYGIPNFRYDQWPKLRPRP